MNKLTAEKCKEFFEQWFRGVEAGDDPEWREPEYQSREWHEYISRRQLALGAWSAALELSHTVPALKLPDEHRDDDGEASSESQMAWNACLAEAKRLNGMTE